MIKLQPDTPNAGITFYFRTHEDCAVFRNVFDNHWCNVPWKQSEEISDDTEIDERERRYMDKPPMERAEDNLSWGFALCRMRGIGMTDAQKKWLKMRKISEDMRDGN